jgi:plastocyanin
MTGLHKLGVVLVAAGLLLGLTACGSSKPKTEPIPPPVDARGKTTFEIDASQNRFTPAAIIIDVGTTVTWRNKDTIVHNVKKSADAIDFGAPFGVAIEDFGPGETYSFTFPKVGTFFYTCTIHNLMTGKVEVVAK